MSAARDAQIGGEAAVRVPPVKTQGIKTKLIGWIGGHIWIPMGGVWREPFMGSGVVGLNLAPGKAVFSDTNPHIIALYQGLAGGGILPADIRHHLEQEGARLQKDGAVHYLRVRERFNKTRDPLDFLFLNRSCFNGVVRFNQSHEFNTPFGHKPDRFSKAYVTKVVEQAHHFAERAKERGWEFHCRPFQASIAEAGPEDFIYCDPPYIGRDTGYYDRWREGDEAALEAALRGSGARFMVSTWTRCGGRENPHVKGLWGGCRVAERQHRYFVGPKGSNRPTVTEALLMNYAADGAIYKEGGVDAC